MTDWTDKLRNAHGSASFTRRGLLRAGAIGAGGLAAAALIGCGGDDEEAPGAADAVQKPADSGTDTTDKAGPGQLIKDDSLPYPYQFPEPAKQPKPGGVLVVGVNSDISTFDPTKTTASGTGRVVNMVYNRLLGFNRGIRLHPFKLEFEPELAKSWERTPDGMTYTFQLREDVKWHNLPPLNGRAFVAEDVKFAYEKYKSGGVNSSYWVGADRIETPDGKTLKVTLKKPLADFLTPLASAYQTIFPRELSESGEIDKKAIGTGPMILKEAITSEKVTFDKNPEYWEKQILLHGVEFRVMVDTPARLAAYRAGQIDFGDILVTTTADAKALEASNPGTQFNMSATVLGQAFAMNLSNPKFQDVRVRRALSMGIDREALVNLVYPGLGKVMPMFPWIFLLDQRPDPKGLGPWAQYNPEEAKKLLTAAGAERLELNNRFFPYSQAYEQLNDIHTDQFRKIGVTMTGGKVDYTEFNSQWTGRKLPEVSTGGWTTIGFDADNYFYNCIHSTAPGNRWNLNDPQVDTWAEQAQVELNPQRRKEFFKQIWDHDLDQAYHPVVGSGSGFYNYQPWVRGIRFGGAMGSSNNYQDIGDMMGDAWLDK